MIQSFTVAGSIGEIGGLINRQLTSVQAVGKPIEIVSFSQSQSTYETLIYVTATVLYRYVG